MSTPPQVPNQTPNQMPPLPPVQPGFSSQPYGTQPYGGQPYGVQPYARVPDAGFAGKVRVLGILYAVLGALGLLIALGIGSSALWMTPAAVYSNATAGEVTTTAVTTHLPTSVAGIIVTLTLLMVVLLAAIPFATAYGLLKRRPWGRTMAIVQACLIVLGFPVGTALGGFTLYVMLQGAAREEYAALSAGTL